MDEIKLKPCPFCGSSVTDSYPEGERPDGKLWRSYYIHCNNCGCNGPLTRTRGYNISSKKARNASINLWNGRVQCQPND